MRNLLLALCLFTSHGVAGTILKINTLPSNYEHGTYNGFVTATVNGVSGIQLICDDYAHRTAVPSADLQYHESELVGFSPLQYARFVTPGGPTSHDFALYMQAALIVDGIGKASPSQTADYQYALWHLFDSSAPLWRTAQQTILDDTAWQVQNNSSSYTSLYSRLKIYTPYGASASNQEFLGLDPPLPTPEPGTGALLGLAGGMYWLFKKVRRSRNPIE